MDRVAAEIAQEIGVLLQHDDIDAGAREQEAAASSRPVRRPAITQRVLSALPFKAWVAEAAFQSERRRAVSPAPGAAATTCCRRGAGQVS